MSNNRYASVAAVAVMSAFFAGAAAGQRIWIEPRAGWAVPTRDLGRTDIISQSGYGIFQRAEGSVTLGVAVGMELHPRWALRASFDRSFDASVTGEWRCVPFVACPAVLLPLEGELHRWSVTIDGLYRPATGLPVTPVFFAGVGLRRSALDWNPPAADITLPASSFHDLSPTARAGIGLERGLGGFASLFGEATMSAARFGGGGYESIEGSVAPDRRVAVDVGLAAGLRIHLTR